MMRFNNIKMKTTVRKEELLTTLEKNLARHRTIAKEAREGYVKKSVEALEERLKDARAGKTVSLSFTLQPPLDHSEVYRTCIAMIKSNVQETVELEADEYRQLMLDEWEWKRSFLTTNMAYSGEAILDFDGMSDPGRDM